MLHSSRLLNEHCNGRLRLNTNFVIHIIIFDMRNLLTLAILIIFSTSLLSQKVNRPNYGLKSPSTAEIMSVDYKTDCTEVEIRITNQVENGFFCIDKNTYLIKPDLSNVFLKKISGLKFCPDVYKFKSVGESVSVTLVFPATGYMDWFSLIEDCDGGCLTFRGVVTNEELNKDLDAAFDAASFGQYEDAVGFYRSVIEKYDAGNEGAVYSDLILFLKENEEEELAKSIYQELINSDVHDLALYIESLKQQGISY